MRPPQSNNGMHPTRDTKALISGRGLGRRVMPGVRPFRNRSQFMTVTGRDIGETPRTTHGWRERIRVEGLEPGHESLRRKMERLDL